MIIADISNNEMYLAQMVVFEPNVDKKDTYIIQKVAQPLER